MQPWQHPDVEVTQGSKMRDSAGFSPDRQEVGLLQRLTGYLARKPILGWLTWSLVVLLLALWVNMLSPHP
jgi:hypothetical protein